MNIPTNFYMMSVAEKIAWLKSQETALSAEKNAEVEKLNKEKTALVEKIKGINAKLKQLGVGGRGRPAGSKNANPKQSAKQVEKSQVLNVLKSGVETGAPSNVPNIETAPVAAIAA
jgi:hypothetical protein